MSDVILSIAIFHSLSALTLFSGVLLSAFSSKRTLLAARRLPVIARTHFAAPRAVPAPVPAYDALPAAA